MKDLALKLIFLSLISMFFSCSNEQDNSGTSNKSAENENNAIPYSKAEWKGK
jgi:hypothetical protein